MTCIAGGADMPQDIWPEWVRGISIVQQLYCEVVHKGHYRAKPAVRG